MTSIDRKELLNNYSQKKKGQYICIAVIREE